MSAINTDNDDHSGNYNRRPGPGSRTVFARAFTLGAVLVAAAVGIVALASGGARADVDAVHHTITTHSHVITHIPATATQKRADKPATTVYQHGAWVTKLQRELGYLNYYEAPVDGIYGPQTTAAVKDFQRNNHLAVDGIAGPKTTALISQQMKTGDSQMTAN